jgi:hypothetical protein
VAPPPAHPIAVRFERFLFDPDDPSQPESGGVLSSGLVLAKPLVFQIDDPSSPYLVQLTIVAWNGRFAATRVAVSARAFGEPVTATGMRRVTIERYVARIRQWISEQTPNLYLGTPISPDVVSYRFASLSERATAGTDKRRQISRGDLERVAAAYRAALASADPRRAAAPVLYVADVMHCSRSHAARLVGRARRVGLLGRALRGLAGEAEAD